MKTITTTFFSTLDPEQTKDCLKFFLFPWRWGKYKNGESIKKAEELMKKYLSKESDTQCFSFYNGRTALYYALKAAGASYGDEVILQAYTCVSVPNSILALGAKPVYCDIDESLNLDPEDLRKKITKKTKAVIVQHTFGNPAQIDLIKKICDNGAPSARDKIFIIEDCAHSLGAEYNDRPVGAFGDISIFSFGRDKVISSINGGMVCVNNKDLIAKIEDDYKKLSFPSYALIMRNLSYPLLAAISLKWYNKFKIGKVLMYLGKKLKIIPLILSEKEKNNFCLNENYLSSDTYRYRMPNVLAYLFVKQFKNLSKSNEHRRKLASFYGEKLKDLHINFPLVLPKSVPIYLRYAIFSEQALGIINKAKEKNIYLGDWYRNVIAPSDVNLKNVGYVKGMCQRAENFSSLSLNLPNHLGISLMDAERVLKLLF